jgi:hypothetical protein
VTRGDADSMTSVSTAITTTSSMIVAGHVVVAIDLPA